MLTITWRLFKQFNHVWWFDNLGRNCFGWEMGFINFALGVLTLDDTMTLLWWESEWPNLESQFVFLKVLKVKENSALKEYLWVLFWSPLFWLWKKNHYDIIIQWSRRNLNVTLVFPLSWLLWFHLNPSCPGSIDVSLFILG